MRDEYKVLTRDGSYVHCYGTLFDDSNFHVVCENEDDDEVWTDGSLENESGSFSSWEEVVAELQGYFASDIVEISAM